MPHSDLHHGLPPAAISAPASHGKALPWARSAADEGRSRGGWHAVSVALPVWFQRVESAAVAALVVVAFVQLDFAWWWLLAVFLLWDLSMVGYIASPRLGAISYNIGHSYLGPAALLALTWVSDARWPAFVALTWAFHIAVDRLLGYGLKFTDRFTHTHLGELGKDRQSTRTP